MNRNDGRPSGPGGQEPLPDNSDPTGIGPPPPGSTTDVTSAGTGITKAASVTSDDDEPSANALAE